MEGNCLNHKTIKITLSQIDAIVISEMKDLIESETNICEKTREAAKVILRWYMVQNEYSNYIFKLNNESEYYEP
jgi:hypothetical protein